MSLEFNEKPLRKDSVDQHCRGQEEKFFFDRSLMNFHADETKYNRDNKNVTIEILMKGDFVRI